VTSTTADAADVRAADAEPAPTDPGTGADPEPTTGGGTTRSFLPLPPPLDARTRRVHRVVLGLLMFAGLLVGTYWTFATVVWNPIDEVAHFGYVESLATGDGVPTVGVDLLSDETLASFKATPTLLFRSYPYQPVSSDENWGGTRHQYEAVHGPTYYVAMVPAYWIGKPFGVMGSLYAIRFATVALVLLAVPLTWMLARRLFPDRPKVWLIAPALLITVNSLSPGAVSNDAMVLVLSITTILVFLRALDAASGGGSGRGWDRGRTWVPAAGAGALFGLTIVTKMTSLVLIPFLAIAFVAWVVTRRPRFFAVARFVALVAGGAIVTFAPWLAWNLHSYRSTSAAGVVEGITGASLPESTLGIDAIVQHATVARPGVWVNQLLLGGSYQTTWEYALIASLVLGAIAAAVRTRWRDLAVLLWCGSALPLAFASMEVIVFVLFGGTGGPMGRHLIAALAPTMVMVAAAIVLVVGSRWAPPVAAALVTATLAAQAPLAKDFVDHIYLRASIDHRVAPVVYQDWSDGVLADQTTIQVDAGCPVEIIGVGIMDPTLGTEPGGVPTALVVRSAAGETAATGGAGVYDIATYRLATPVEGSFTIEVPAGTVVRSTGDDRTPDASWAGAGGDPVVTAYCAADDPDSISFDLIYPVGHPDWVPLGALQATPAIFAWLGAAVTLGLTALAISGRGRSREGASRSDERTPSLPA
jgi:hypothetical protein